MLKPQDVVVALALVSLPASERGYAKLAGMLGMSASETHAAVKRATASGLLDRVTRAPRRSALLEFLVHGIRYVFPAVRSGLTRGVPTSYGMAPLCGHVYSDEPPPVWPHPEGTVRGEGLEPLYRSVPAAALANPRLHELLSLVDALRSGRARERKLAADELARRLGS
jgi:hypothetical protein